MEGSKKQKVPVDRKNIILKTLDSHLHMSNATTPKWIRLGKNRKQKKKKEIQRKGITSKTDIRVLDRKLVDMVGSSFLHSAAKMVAIWPMDRVPKCK